MSRHTRVSKILLTSILIGLVSGASAADAPLAPTNSPKAPAPPPEAQSPVGAGTELEATQGHTATGTLSFTPGRDGVRIAGTVKGLKPNADHGFHVHEKGDCSAPDASSAGDHFNPQKKPHGKPATKESHVGDLPNIKADARGTAQVDAVLKGATLRTGEASDIAGKAVVIHEKADDYASQPAGNSGDRIACGAIR